mmetsp:Transcript_14194/g.40238  ORF Transcript_14194/g.40238 Transcript_14194/m.40238 type:complete len:130 (+) Transcript_14194:222-611(+)
MQRLWGIFLVLAVSTMAAEEPLSGKPLEILVNGVNTDPSDLPDGVNRYIIMVKPGIEQRDKVRALLQERLSDSYTELKSPSRLLPMFVALIPKDDLIRIFEAAELADVREAMVDSFIEPDGISYAIGGA